MASSEIQTTKISTTHGTGGAGFCCLWVISVSRAGGTGRTGIAYRGAACRTSCVAAIIIAVAATVAGTGGFPDAFLESITEACCVTGTVCLANPVIHRVVAAATAAISPDTGVPVSISTSTPTSIIRITSTHIEKLLYCCLYYMLCGQIDRCDNPQQAVVRPQPLPEGQSKERNRWALGFIV